MKQKFKIIRLLIVFVFGVILFSNLVDSLSIKSITTTPKEIGPGESARILISLKNDGDYDIEDVLISLDLRNLPIAPYGTGSEILFDEIIEDKTKNADFEIMAFSDAKSGNYNIPIKISYKENDEVKIRESLVSVTVNSKPIIEANFEEGVFLKGQNNKLTLKIINKGLGDAKFLEVELKGSICCTILSNKYIYLGDIDSDDFQTFDINVYIKGSSPNTINIPITIKYKDFSNNDYSNDLSISTRVYSINEANNLGLIPKNNTLYIVIIVIILIVVFFIYRFIRRKRRQKLE